MRWHVQITGEVIDLEALSRSFTDDELRIIEEEGKYFLESKRFDGLTASEEVLEKAKEICGLVSGIARLAYGARTVLKAENVYRLNPDGRRNEFPIIKDGLEARTSIRAVIVITSEVVVETLDPARNWIAVAEKNESVSKALRLFGTDTMDWVGLYRVYEVIEQDVGGLKYIASAGWSTEEAIRRFRHTANSPAATGDMSRHGKENTQPPKKPMNLSEARSLVEVLLHNWIRGKSETGA